MIKNHIPLFDSSIMMVTLGGAVYLHTSSNELISLVTRLWTFSLNLGPHTTFYHILRLASPMFYIIIGMLIKKPVQYN